MAPNAAKRAKLGTKAQPVVKKTVNSKDTHRNAPAGARKTASDSEDSPLDESSLDESSLDESDASDLDIAGSDASASDSDDSASDNDSLDESAGPAPSDSEQESASSDNESGDSDDPEDSESRPVAAKSDGFDTAMSAILGSRVKAHDASNPILIRNKRSAKEIDDAREERKVRRALRADKLQHKDKARVKDVVPKDPELAGDVISREKLLRKTAQRGVVKLLNAINSAQSAAIADAAPGVTDKRKAEASTDLSKEKFLDMIRMG